MGKKEQIKVLIVTGGTDSERKISLLSAKNVKKNLEQAGYFVKLFDLKKGYLELKPILKKYDVIFPVLHGEQGEGGELQKFLAQQKVKYVGGDWKGFKQGFYKIPFKKFCDKNNIPTAKWQEVKSKADIVVFGFPCVLKSSGGGRSVILKSVEDLNSVRVQRLLKSKTPALVEEFVKGYDVTVCFISNISSVNIYPKIEEELMTLIAEKTFIIHHTLKLGNYSQIDFIISKKDFFAKSVHPIPELTSTGLFLKTLRRRQMSFSDLL